MLFRNVATRGRRSKSAAATTRTELMKIQESVPCNLLGVTLIRWFRFPAGMLVCTRNLGQDRGMASVITTGWHLWVIKGGGGASKELTLPALTFTKVEIKAPLQKIYGNSNVQSATVFVRCLARTHARTHRAPHSGVGWVTSRWRACAVISGRSRRRTCTHLSEPEQMLLHSACFHS